MNKLLKTIDVIAKITITQDDLVGPDVLILPVCGHCGGEYMGVGYSTLSAKKMCSPDCVHLWLLSRWARRDTLNVREAAVMAARDK